LNGMAEKAQNQVVFLEELYGGREQLKVKQG
jgi:hypothetical protein